MVDEEAELKALMLAGLAGDAGAHRRLLTKLAPRLRAYFRGKTNGRADDAEDLTQETLIAIHTRRETYDASYPLTSWVFAIAKYRFIDHWRRNKRQGGAISLDDAPDLPVEPEADAADARRDVARLLALLPQKQQDAIRLVKLEGVSVADAAKQLSLSESDVKVSAHRGLKALTRLMGQEQP